MRMLLLITLLTLSGCGTMPTDQQRYERANAEVLRLEAFVVFTAQCERHGGMVAIVRREWAPRHCAWRTCPPGRTDIVRCVAR